MQHLKFPIGTFTPLPTYNPKSIQENITTIEALPGLLKTHTAYLSQTQLDTTYRPQGWTIRQVVHHLADSHINSFIRFKLAITEPNPTIKPYLEHLWAELPDSKMPIEPSIKILEGVHQRWTTLLQSLTEAQLNCTYYHPEAKQEFNLKTAIHLYAWHCSHHLAHITNTIKNNNW